MRVHCRACRSLVGKRGEFLGASTQYPQLKAARSAGDALGIEANFPPHSIVAFDEARNTTSHLLDFGNATPQKEIDELLPRRVRACL